MSTDSLALLRPNPSTNIRTLAEAHYNHDLLPSDRENLQSAAQKIGWHTTIGSALGLGLGLFLAFRVRSARMKMFDAFRAHERPTSVRWRDGREEAIPDITPLVKPSIFGDVAAYMLFGTGGLFLGGETGLLTGTGSARRTIAGDVESSKRIEAAFAKFRAEVLRKEADELDGGGKVGSVMDKFSL